MNKISKKSRLHRVLLTLVPALIVAGLVWGANMYYDLDTQKVMVDQVQRVIQRLEVVSDITVGGTATTTNIYPSADITYVLGAQNYRWANLYAATTTIDAFKMATGAVSGYVLTSDVSGIGTWQEPAAGVLGGSGTLNYIAKFTATTTLGNSIIYDDGTYIGVGTTTPAAILDVYASSTATALTVTQSGTGNLVDFKIGATSKFVIDNSGVITTGEWKATVIGTQWGGTGQNWSSAATGSIPFATSTGVFSLLEPGTANYFLKTQGPGQPPIWAEVAASLWTDAGTYTYLTATADDLVLGSNTTSTAPFFFDVSAARLQSYTALTISSGSSGNISLQPASGILEVNASGIQNKLRVYDSAGTDYLELSHDSTDALITTNVCQVAIGLSDIYIGETGSPANLIFKGSSAITGQGFNTITLGASGDTFNLNTSGVTYNYGNMNITGAISQTGTSSVTLSGNVTAQSNLTVEGNSLTQGNATTTGNFNVTGPTTIATTTTPQLTIKYDSSNYFKIDVSATGQVSFDATGTSAGFVFEDLATTTKGLVFKPMGAPTAQKGYQYYDSSSEKMLFWDGNSWKEMMTGVELWTDAGTFTYLTTTTDDLVLGSNTTSCQATATTVSRTIEDNPFSSKFAGTDRIHKFVIRYADSTTTASSTWTVWNVTGVTTTATFQVPPSDSTDLGKGEAYITPAVNLPATTTDDWNLRVEVPSGVTIQIYEIFLAAYDKIL